MFLAPCIFNIFSHILLLLWGGVDEEQEHKIFLVLLEIFPR